ncbi:phosphotransferase family protein [Nocardiopsis sp. LOL_012]|uniref:phosphotransferase family protein n=1 Tax=Nocardiopsis sp. LOL_012 TaxID=3345409 RepID=UPI003A84A7BC
MTALRTAPGVPAAALTAARTWGWTGQDATLLRHHGAIVVHLPQDGVVLRLTPAEHAQAAERAVIVTRWLLERGVAVTEPAHVEQPLHLGEAVATAWIYYPQPAFPSESAPEHLGRILADLHRAGTPPVDLPAYRPLAALDTTLDTARCLDEQDIADLRNRIKDLRRAYDSLDFPLGTGLVHGDAYPGNTLLDERFGVRLGDWDECAFGPREVDLANVWQGQRRFGRPLEHVEVFSRAYGYDLSSWSGIHTLVSLRDLHTLSAFIRAADRGDHNALAQVRHRIRTLDDPTASWASR